jgi:hypothetical protein
VLIRPARPEDHDAIWRILESVIRAGETYPLPRDMSQPEAIAYWIRPDRETFVAEEGPIICAPISLAAAHMWRTAAT